MDFLANVAGVKNEKAPRWSDIQPGDIGWDEGRAWGNLLIRLLTLGAYSHSFVYVDRYPNGDFKTVEADGRGVRYKRRKPEHVHRVMRLWKSEWGRQRIIAEAHSHIGKCYGWLEIIAIGLNKLGIKVSAPDNPETMICSNSAARAAVAGDVWVSPYLTRRPDRIWPARLERDLNHAIWEHENRDYPIEWPEPC